MLLLIKFLIIKKHVLFQILTISFHLKYLEGTERYKEHNKNPYHSPQR